MQICQNLPRLGCVAFVSASCLQWTTSLHCAASGTKKSFLMDNILLEIKTYDWKMGSTLFPCYLVKIPHANDKGHIQHGDISQK